MATTVTVTVTATVTIEVTVVAVTPTSEDTTVWAQLAGNPQRTAYIAGTPGSAPYTLKWIWNGPASAGDGGPQAGHLSLYQNIEPVLGNSRLYVADEDGIIYAILLSATGEPTPDWTYDTESVIQNTGAYSVSENAVYFGAMNGYLYKINATTGALINSVNLGGTLRGAPLLVGDLIIVPSTDGNLYARYKTTLGEFWTYDSDSSFIASPAYSANYGGLVIIPSEDSYVHAVQITTGLQRWRVLVNSDQDDLRGNARFADTYPVVADTSDCVIVRSYMAWEKMWNTSPAPDTIAEIQSYLTSTPADVSFHVLELDDGASRFLAPVLAGAIGNGGDFESVPPQAAIRTISGEDFAYVLWRNSLAGDEDGRSDSCMGEMDLDTGNIRFIQDYKEGGSFRCPTDEQSYLTLVGDSIYHVHWMLTGGVKITDRGVSYGDTYSNGIRASEVTPIGNTMGDTQGAGRDSTNHYYSSTWTPPGDGWVIDAGHYVYRDDAAAYDTYWNTPTRHLVYHQGVIYLRTSDGAIIALNTGGT